MNRALQLAEVPEWRKKQEEGRKQGKFIGLGIAFVVEPAGVATPNARYSGMVQARIRVTPDGLVEVYSDRTETWTGCGEVDADAVAKILGANLSDVVVKPVTSDMVGMGPVSSRGIGSIPSASIAKAAKEIRATIVKVRRRPFRRVTGRHRSQRWSDLFGEKPAAKAHIQRVSRPSASSDPVPKGSPKSDATKPPRFYQMSPPPGPARTLPRTLPRVVHPPLPSAADVAAVEVDTETGATKILRYVHVHDAGKIISKESVDQADPRRDRSGDRGSFIRGDPLQNMNGELGNRSYGDLRHAYGSGCPRNSD